MKKVLLSVLIICSLTRVAAQVTYNNEWIDYNKTYYKFLYGGLNEGLVRIPQSTLAAAGLGAVPAEQFQLWRNGKEVTLYTSVSSGAMGAGDYIEFWGVPNDGKPDKNLYLNPAFQLSDKWSLFWDTATYFLTVNPSGPNLRYTTQVNNVAGNSLSPESYFMYTDAFYPRLEIHPGFAAVVGEYVYSSSFDRGEFWIGESFGNHYTRYYDTDSLFVNSTGPNASFQMGCVGRTLNIRNVQVTLNGSQILNQQLNYFNDAVMFNNNVPLSLLTTTDKASYNFKSDFCDTCADDFSAFNYITLTYPRKFNFAGKSNFRFDLQGTNTAKYIEIVRFNHGGQAPVLYDIDTRERFVGDISDPTKVKFALPASANSTRRLLLVSYAASNVRTITSVTPKTFVNYNTVSNQGDYYIITHPYLYNNNGGTNPIEDYKNYRISAAGGSYNVKTVDINELYDQFCFGIKYHSSPIQNFIRFSRNVMTVKPKFFFLIGKGCDYYTFRYQGRDTFPASHRINLIPTFGTPASDNLYSSDPGQQYAKTPIGRLSVVSKDEISSYLLKVEQYENVIPSATQDIAGKGWMKTVVHAIGGADEYTSALLTGYMRGFEQIIEDTVYGANVHTFIKSTANNVEQITNQELNRLFAEGIGLLSYFGHSSANTLEFNLNDPQSYNNTGKYPVFIVNGCNSGNMFLYDTLRTTTNLSLSERYVLANQKGSVAFFASTHWGLPYYLNILTNYLYKNISYNDYGQPLGDVLLKATTQMLTAAGPADYFARQHAEQCTLHGDPALKLYAHAKPDYTIEDPLLKINPSFISIAETTFHVEAKFLNIGKSPKDSIYLEIKRVLPNGTTVSIIKKRVTGIRYADSLVVDIPINPLTDKGLNKIIATCDVNGEVDEMSETNNSVTKEFYIFEDEARPVYPYNYAIVSNPAQKLQFSTANPFSTPKTYMIEIDTTELFNSSLKVTKTVVSSGGVAEVVTGMTYRDSTVYYWRVAPQPSSGLPVWNVSSFIFLANSQTGFNQSHYFQYNKNSFYDKEVNPGSLFQYAAIDKKLRIRNGLLDFFDYFYVDVTLDGDFLDVYANYPNNWKIMVFDPVTLAPIKNPLNKWGSWDAVFPPSNSFEYQNQDREYRRKMMNVLLDSIPNGYYVYIGWMGTTWNSTFISDWQADAAYPGFSSTRNLYTAFKQLGLNAIDSFTWNHSCIFFFKKNDNNFPKTQLWGATPQSFLDQTFTLPSRKEEGEMSSVWLGPAKKWKELHWRATPLEPTGQDSTWIKIYGKKLNGQIDSLATVFYAQDTSVAWIDAKVYPYVQLRFKSNDYEKATPPQMRYWRLNADYVPEGAVAPNIYFTTKDTLQVGEPLKFGIAFKNISETAFDSLKIKMIVTDRNNTPITIPLPKARPIIAGDTIRFEYTINTTNLTGLNTLFLFFNPDNDQPEQYTYNNFLYRNFFVKPDNYNPLMDVTFDGIHILDRDVVSSQPHIQIKLHDDSKFLALNDTSLIRVKIRSITGNWIRSYFFNSPDTMRFTPANLATGDNSAMVDFYPYLPEDGDYELIVSGVDKSGNKAGNLDYRVSFKVINKPMITEVFNYPNPFTTSTAFVFTLTGKEVPQQLKIEIMTITGKIVKEITQDELGPIRIGRNITEYKWDGTDMYGNKLANGVYLYRVVTNLNGNKLDKYTPDDLEKNPSKYFNRGYGKMVILR